MIPISLSRKAALAPAMALVATALLALAAAPVRAQSAALVGRIVDSTGAPVAVARIRIPQLERAVSADSTGRFRIDALPLGRVTVIAEAPGYFGSRREVVIPSAGEVDQSFSLMPNAHVLAEVEVRARARQQLPAKLQEFAYRQHRGVGRFLGPDDMTRFNGQPLTEALKTVLTGARFARNVQGQMTIISARTLNAPTSLRSTSNVKSCGVQIWQDGILLSDPNSSADIALPTGPTARQVTTMHAGADHDYDISGMLADEYMAVEYYSDLSTTPPGFRTGTQSCGVLALWTRVPMEKGTK
jgi:hypothetical protein